MSELTTVITEISGTDEAARECYKETEATLAEKQIALPFPSSKELPWGIKVVQPAIDSAGGAWETGTACKKRSGLAIIASVELRDGNLWYHVSLSRNGKMPSYADISWVKEIWMGDRWAIQCFVPKSEHVNIHPNCLHLWHSLTSPRPFPEFAVQGNI